MRPRSGVPRAVLHELGDAAREPNAAEPFRQPDEPRREHEEVEDDDVDAGCCREDSPRGEAADVEDESDEAEEGAEEAELRPASGEGAARVGDSVLREDQRGGGGEAGAQQEAVDREEPCEARAWVSAAGLGEGRGGGRGGWDE